MTRLFFLCWLALAPLMKIIATDHKCRGLLLDSYFYSIGLYVQPYTTTTADDDCSHEIKRCLFPGRKAITNLDSILKSRDITLPTKVHLGKAMVFPVVMYGCESWTIKKAEHWRNDAFELWCWRRLLRVPWKARRSSQSNLKESSPEYSLEGLMLKLKLQYFGPLMWSHWKRPWCWERLKAAGEGDDRGWDGWMASPTRWTWVWASSGRWYWQGSLVCWSPWGCKKSDMTEHLNWTELNTSSTLFWLWCSCRNWEVLFNFALLL